MLRRSLGNPISWKSRIFSKHGVYPMANLNLFPSNLEVGNTKRHISSGLLSPKKGALHLGPRKIFSVIMRGIGTKNQIENVKDEKKVEKKDKDANADKDEDNVFSVLGAILILIICVALIPSDNTEEEIILDETKCPSKVLADKQPGKIVESDKIERVQYSTRIPIQNLTSHGIEHAGLEGTLWDCQGTQKCWYRQRYWNDEAVYELSLPAAEELRLATEELHAMCLEAVDTVVNSNDLMTLFEIPENMRDEVRRSWNEKERDFLGRFDFMWDGRGPPKMAEYNADTPTILVETAVGQALWYEYVAGKGSNNRWVFNDLEQQLVNSWKAMVPAGTKVHLIGILSSVEEREHIQYLKNTAQRAGLSAIVSDVSLLEEIDGKLVALEAGAESLDEVKFLFKLYPWEWLSHEKLGGSLLKSDKDTRVVEPAWKLILGNKAILALLWHLFPNHPNLLPSYFEGDIQTMAGKDFVAKPKFGREGQGIVYSRKCSSLPEFISMAERNLYVSESGDKVHQPSDYGPDSVYLGYPVYQQHCDTARFSGRHVVIGSWVVGGVPAGFNFREDSTDTTQDHSSFVPHLIKGGNSKDFGKLKGQKWNDKQKSLYRELYGIQVEAPSTAPAQEKRTHSSGSGGGYWRSWGYGSGNSNSNTNTNTNNNTNANTNNANTHQSTYTGGGSGSNSGNTTNTAQSTPQPGQPHPSNAAKPSEFQSAAERFRAKKGAWGFKGIKSTGSSHKVVAKAGMGGGRG